MKRRRSTRLLFAGTIWIVVGLVGSICITRAAAASSAPAVQVSSKTAKIGQLVQVTGTGWSPVGQTVQIELCGQDALHLSDDCDQADEYSAAIRAGGVFYGAVLTHLPPSPCPCVVLVTNQGAFSGVRVPITIAGAPTAPLPPQVAPSSPVVLSAKVLTPVSVSAWFGGPRAVILVLRITNSSTGAYESPALSVTVGKGRHASDFVVARPLAPLPAGATQVLRIPVTLPAFTFGQYSVRAQVITGQGQVATVKGTNSYPWGLFVVAALILQVALLLLRNRVRARLGRDSGAELPVEGPELQAPAEPVEVVDLRLPIEEPELQALAEPVDVVDLRLPVEEPEVQGRAQPVEVVDLTTSPVPADVWTATYRLAVPFPQQGLTCKVEVLTCPAVGLRRTTVLAWDEFAVSPWDAVHEGTMWAEVAADAPLNALVQGETFCYDGRGAHLELHVSATGPELTLGENRTALPVRVQGSASLGDVTSHLDVESALEQAWVTDPPDAVFMTSSEAPVGSFTYGQAVGGDSFYLRFRDDGESDGWLIRDGRASAIVGAVRRVEERVGPYPRRLTVELSDDLGRQALASGTASNGMASKADDGLILECRTDWDLDGVPALGEDRSEVDLGTWRGATRSGFHAAANENGDAATVGGQIPSRPTADL